MSWSNTIDYIWLLGYVRNCIYWNENSHPGRAESQYQQDSAVIPVIVNTITSGGNWIGTWMFTALQKAHTLNLRLRNKIQGAQTTHCILLKLVISHTKEFQNCSIFRPFYLTKTLGRQLLAHQPLFLICARGICPGFLLYACKNYRIIHYLYQQMHIFAFVGTNNK